VNTECSTDSRKPTLVAVSAENEARTGTTRAGARRAPARPSRRFDRTSLGFWLGGATLGTGGCIFATCMPHDHPVGLTIGVIWWGIYFGCFGASLGALVGWFIDCAPSAGRTGAVARPPTEEESTSWAPHTDARKRSGKVEKNGPDPVRTDK
jgi:hypothetical protein